MATASPSSTPPLSMDVRVQLSVMMFLQFAVWGAWAVVFFNYLLKMGFTGGAAGWITANMALGAIISPMVVGLLADRFIASEKLMAVLHLAGAGLLFLQAQIGTEHGFFLFYSASLIYALVFNPTLTLANSITFTHAEATRDFPSLRVWGTIGWIVANAIVGFTLDQNSNQPLLLAAGLSAVLGVFSIFLPHTPPTGKPGDPLPFTRAMGLFKEWTFAVFFVVSGLITIVLAFYYTNTPSYLLQCDARMVPSLVRGTFEGTDTIRLKVPDPEGKDTEATLDNVKAVTIAVTARGEDGKESPVAPAVRRLLNPPIQEQIQVEIDEKGVAEGISLTTRDSPKVERQVKQEVEEGGKKVEKWVTVQKTQLPSGGGRLDTPRKPDQTVTMTLERTALNPANTMLWGQICEMIFLPLLPFFLIRFGMKWVLIFGMLAWGLRYVLFAAAFPAGPFWAVFLGILLHGICFDFFLAAGMIHVDNTAPKEIRASAQALFGLLTYGIGMWLGTILSGYLNQVYTTNTLVHSVNWTGFWLVPAYGIIAGVIVFALLFNIAPKKKKKA